MREWLLDTGPIVAYLDSNDPAHHQVSTCLDAFGGQLHTTSAVITEAMYFVSAHSAGPRLLAAFIAESKALVHDLAQSDDLREAIVPMEKYADIPMDYADATLVLLGERLGLRDILTLDRRGFSVFRVDRNKPFRLVLDEVPPPTN